MDEILDKPIKIINMIYKRDHRKVEVLNDYTGIGVNRYHVLHDQLPSIPPLVTCKLLGNKIGTEIQHYNLNFKLRDVTK